MAFTTYRGLVQRSDGAFTGAAGTAIDDSLAALADFILDERPVIIDPPSAITPVESLSPNYPMSSGARSDGPFHMGFSFTISAPITVSALGRYWSTGNTSNRVVKLWDTSNTTTPIASGTVTNASTSDANGVKWVLITPVTLSTSATYVLACDEYSGENWMNEWTIAVPSPLTVITSRYQTSLGAFPSNTNSAGSSYSTPAMRYTTASVGLLIGSCTIYDVGGSPVGFVPVYDSIG